MEANSEPQHGSRRRRTREDWTAAALAALAEGGAAAVAIEALATRVGATKGSAYWHFPNRDALLAAALERWESEHTESMITKAEAETDPRQRLRLLFGSVLELVESNSIELALLASADDPVVAPVLRRVTERRVSYLATLFAKLGFGKAEARRRALLGYTAYLGHAQLLRTTPDALPTSPRALRGYLDEIIEMIIGAAGDR